MEISGIGRVISNLVQIMIVFKSLLPAKCSSSSSIAIQPHVIFLQAAFDKVPIANERLTHFSTQMLKSVEECAAHCAREQGSTRTAACYAFTREYFGNGYYRFKIFERGFSQAFADSPLDFFKFRALYDTFRDVYVDGRVISMAIGSESKSYQDASAACREIGGFLYQLDSLEKYVASRLMIRTHPVSRSLYWVGATDEAVEGEWLSDKSGQLLVDDTTWFWQGSKPLVHDRWGNCAQLKHDNKLRTDYCKNENSYMCEKNVTLNDY